VQELVHHLLDFAEAKRVFMDLPHFVCLGQTKEIVSHIQHFIMEMLDQVNAVKLLLDPLIAKVVEKANKDTARLKALIAQLVTYADHNKV
jgi:hypothetical protein